MKTSPSRLRRHLSYANVMASIAVFLAFGGVGYAATTLNGKQIVNHSIGAGKLKNGTLTSSQVKANGMTGAVIDESSLATVPQAQAAVSATTAGTAGTAASAEKATIATSAESATTAADADTVDGVSAAELRLACPAETELFGGMCWDESARSAHGWIIASTECGEAGGRLPSLSELIAYVLQTGVQVSGPTWSNDVLDVSSGEPIIAIRDEATSGTSSALGSSLGYRCLFYRVN